MSPHATEPAKAGDIIVAPKQEGAQGFCKIWVSDAPLEFVADREHVAAACAGPVGRAVGRVVAVVLVEQIVDRERERQPVETEACRTVLDADIEETEGRDLLVLVREI